MLDDIKKVDLSQHDLDLIEQALHTQEKILTVESRVGTKASRTRLNDLKGLLQRLSRQRQPEPTPCAQTPGFSGFARALFCHSRTT